jgi:hypothetical protein
MGHIFSHLPQFVHLFSSQTTYKCPSSAQCPVSAENLQESTQAMQPVQSVLDAK